MLKQKKLISISILAVLSLTMLSFQNCGKGFQVSEFASESGIDVNSSFPTLQVNLKFANSSSSSNSKNKISFKSSDNLTTNVVKKSTFTYDKPQSIRYFSRNFSHKTDDKSNRFDPYKLLIQMKDKQGQLIYEQIVNNPSLLRSESFGTNGKIEKFDNLTLASFDLNLNLPDIPFTSQLEIYEIKGLNPKKIASFEYKDLKSENKVLDIKLPLNKQLHQKMFAGVEFQVKLYNSDKSLTQVKDTDPINDKINILILSDGFLISNMQSFRSIASDMVETLFKDEPFKSKRNSFNVYFLEIPSRQSCIKESPGDPCDSALKSYFQSPSSRFLMPDSQSVYSYINSAFSSPLPVDRTYQGVIANTNNYGGTGGVIFTQSASIGSAVFVHEFAHSFGGLGDEYEAYYYVPAMDAQFQATYCTPGGIIAALGQFKNISNSDKKEYLPQIWQDFLNTNGNNVGLFEGAGYCPKNRWRPCNDSKMRNLYADWCPVHVKVIDNHIKSFGVSTDLVDVTPPEVNTFQIPATSTSRTLSNITLSASDNVQVTGYMISENQTPPSSTSSGWTSTAPTSFTFSGSGSGNLIAYAWAKDAAGNISTHRAARVTVSIFTEKYEWFAPAFSACTAVSSFSYGSWSDCSAQGQKNRTKTCVVVSATQTRTPVCRNSKNQAVANSMCSDSSPPVSTQNCSSVCSAPIAETETCTPPVQIDRISPTVNSFRMPATSTSRTLSNVIVSASDNVQVTGYMITETQAAPSSSASGWSSSSPTSFTFAGSGSGNVIAYAWAKDAAGNVSNSKSVNVQITVNTTVDVPVFGLKITSVVEKQTNEKSYFVSEPQLKGTPGGSLNSVNVVIQNTGNTACTLSPSSIENPHPTAVVSGLSGAEFSFYASSKSKTIQPNASETITFKARVFTYEFESHLSALNIKAIATFKCDEDSSKTAQLTITFDNPVVFDAGAQKNRACTSKPSLSTKVNDPQSTQKYPNTSPLVIKDGNYIEHYTTNEGLNNYVFLNKNGLYNHITMALVDGTNSKPSNVFFEGPSTDYQIVRDNIDNRIYIDHKNCGRTFVFLPSRQGSGLAINFLDGYVYIDFSLFNGYTDWQLYPVGSYKIPKNTTTQIKLANTFSAGTMPKVLHEKYFGWK